MPASNGIVPSPGRIRPNPPGRSGKEQLITLEGTLKYRDVEDVVEGTTFKHHIAEIHATSMKRLSRIGAQDESVMEPMTGSRLGWTDET